MAIFNFTIKIERHAMAAIGAALDIEHNCKTALAGLLARIGPVAHVELGVGIGID